jgi:lysophospholipase L1-like esterase
MATVSYASSALEPGIAGPYSILKDPPGGLVAGDALYFSLHTRLVMKVTGTELKFTGTTDYGTGDSMFQFSIDGGAFAAQASRVGTVMTVYTGLSDVERTVIIRANPGGSGAAYCLRAGNVLEVTGAVPVMTTITNWETIDSTRADANVAYVAANADWVPTQVPRAGGNSGTYGPNISSVHVRGAYTTLAIVCLSQYVMVSVDGNDPTQYTMPASGFYELTGLSGTHDYYVWGSAANTYDEFLLAVGGNTLSSTITPKKRLDVFGSSTTRGNAATHNGLADVFRVAAHFGYTGCSHGADGDTFASLNTRIVAATSSKTYNNAADCCYVAIGRNDVYGGYNATGKTNFDSIITRLAGIYDKVIVRGLLPSYSSPSETTGEFATDNGIMSGWITSLGFGNVYWVDPIALGWDGPTIARPGDNVHPNDAGYTAIVTYEKNAFAAYLGEPPATGTSACTVWMM